MKFLLSVTLLAFIHCVKCAQASANRGGQRGDVDDQKDEAHNSPRGRVPLAPFVKHDDNMRTGATTEEDDEELGGLEEDATDDVTLISCDEENPAKCELTLELAMMSETIKAMWEGDKDEKTFQLKNIHCAAGPLKNCAKYLELTEGTVPPEIKKPINSTQVKEILTVDGLKIDEKYVTYIMALKKQDVFALILAANYLDIKSLLHLGCVRIAAMIKGKSPEEIKRILGDADGADAAQGNARQAVNDDHRRLLLNMLSA